MSDSEEHEFATLVCHDEKFVISKEKTLISTFVRSTLSKRETNVDADIGIDFVSIDIFNYIVEYMEYRNGIDLKIHDSRINDDSTLLDYVDQKNIDYVDQFNTKDIIQILVAASPDKLDIIGLRKLMEIKLALLIYGKSLDEIKSIMALGKKE